MTAAEANSPNAGFRLHRGGHLPHMLYV